VPETTASAAARPRSVVLHVDDNEANRYVVSRVLRQAGFDVIEGTNGREALDKVRENPDVVVLDVRLPDISGVEVCRIIKSDPATSSIPVLHLSASYTSSGHKAEGLDAGADGYLVRPVEPIELVATVNALLRQRRTEQALRASEERYRLLVDSVRDYAIVTVSMEGRVVSWNPGAERVTGYSESDIVGRPVAMLFEKSTSSAIEDELATAAAQGRSQSERWLVRPDGERRLTSGVAAAMRDASGRLVGFSLVLRDITVERQTESARADSEMRFRQLADERTRLLDGERAAREDAEQANRLKDEFLATLSHELRTPLNAIVGWAVILRRTRTVDAHLADGLATIERNARVQTQLIDDLLDVSRIISGKLRLDVDQVDLAAVVEAAIESVHPASEAREIRVERTLASHQTMVRGDSGRLQQVVWNLLTNAIKFTPRGGQVWVTLGRVDSHVAITVADSGRGIEPAFLPHVFDRFRQADPSTTRTHGGLGLGLAIVRHLVELHGGTVEADSEGRDRGARFTIRLPLNAASARRRLRVKQDGRTFTSLESMPTPGLGGVRVLIVDDSEDSRRLLAHIVEESDASVETAGSAAEAMQRLRTHRYDVIVSDVGMPGRDGYELMRWVRALPADAGGRTPALALTGFARPEDRRLALLSGFQIHLTKPVDPAELLAAIASAAGRTGTPARTAGR
jgi:PAS domain S-box-containing protein